MFNSAPPDCGIGASLERVEDRTLLTGQGRFGDDLGHAPGTLHVAVVRSPHAHARVLGLDKAAAEGVAGCVCRH